jgi:hypothetical protein
VGGEAWAQPKLLRVDRREPRSSRLALRTSAFRELGPGGQARRPQAERPPAVPVLDGRRNSPCDEDLVEAAPARPYRQGLGSRCAASAVRTERHATLRLVQGCARRRRARWQTFSPNGLMRAPSPWSRARQVELFPPAVLGLTVAFNSRRVERLVRAVARSARIRG